MNAIRWIPLHEVKEYKKLDEQLHYQVKAKRNKHKRKEIQYDY